MRMTWGRLLAKSRLGRETDPPQKDVRSEFLRDWDRIVYSSAFRRLQDKTQVFPLAESDYVRTRLTHSLEVASVGRSLGTLAGEAIEQAEGMEADSIAQDCGSIVATACLAHDIGNPPFGHSGEDAIRNWFDIHKDAYLKGIPTDRVNDFLKFEGNAQGFRVLTRLQNSMNQGGLQLTYAVLGAYTKYPRCSDAKDSNTELVSEKKYGYFAADASNFQKVAEGLGLIAKRQGMYARHPLAFLMEAADDICYRIVDLEDGHRVNRVSYDTTHALLWPIAGDSLSDQSRAAFDAIEENKQRVEYMRAHAINSLVYAAVDVFKQQYENIMQGLFESDLMSLCKFKDQLEAIRKESKAHVYSAPNVLHIEAAGFEVLGGLLGKVVPAMLHGEKSGNMAERKLLDIIPAQFKRSSDKYEQLLAATDFVSGMTDTYAVTLYRRLGGIELPTG